MYESLKKQTHKDFEWLVEINTSGTTDFNQSMNKMIARAKGDWIVSIQDFIAVPENALEYIARLPLGFYTFPVGKVLTDNDSPRWDWRMAESRPINFMEWEICFGAAPRQYLLDIGGFDEELDKAWGFDNVNVGFRAERAGYTLQCDNSLPAVAIDHDAFMEHPLKNKRDTALHNQRLNFFRSGGIVQDVQKYMV